MALEPALNEETRESKLRKKIVDEDLERKKQAVVVDQWLEIIRQPLSKNGDKVSLVKRMKNGNKHRLYLGKTKQIAEQIDEYKARGYQVKIF